MSKVSVIVPVHNEERFLARCVDSVFSQTSGDWELVLVDDGSTDSSPELVDELASRDPRVVAFHQSNTGYSGARNKGLELATGEYALFLDGDDFLAPEAVEAGIRDAEAYDVDIIFGGDKVHIFSDATQQKCEGILTYIPSRDYDFDMHDFDVAGETIIGVNGSLIFSVWTKLYRMSIIRDHHIRFDGNLPVQEDVNFILSYLYYCRRGLLSKTQYYNYCRELDKDDVGERPFIDQYIANEAALQSFNRMTFKFGYPESYNLQMWARLADFYLQLASKITQGRTGLSAEEQDRHILIASDGYAFRFYSRMLADSDPFWASMQNALATDDRAALCAGFRQKMIDDDLPRIGARNIADFRPGIGLD